MESSGGDSSSGFSHNSDLCHSENNVRNDVTIYTDDHDSDINFSNNDTNYTDIGKDKWRNRPQLVNIDCNETHNLQHPYTFPQWLLN